MKSARIMAAAVLAAAATAQAGVLGPAQLLSTLLETQGSDPSILVGDKLFHHFEYNATGDMPAANLVNVIPITDVYGNFGLRFQGAFQDKAGGGASDALISYVVDVQDEVLRISDAHIMGDTAVYGVGNVSITESWVPEVGNATIGIWDIKPGDTQLVDSIDFTPNSYGTLHVQKDILADAGPAFFQDGDFQIPNYSVANVTFVDQTYSQTPGGGETPEPASLGLLAIGSVALFARRRRA
jgi:hypothetical protein